MSIYKATGNVVSAFQFSWYQYCATKFGTTFFEPPRFNQELQLSAFKIAQGREALERIGVIRDAHDRKGTVRGKRRTTLISNPGYCDFIQIKPEHFIADDLLSAVLLAKLDFVSQHKRQEGNADPIVRFPWSAADTRQYIGISRSTERRLLSRLEQIGVIMVEEGRGERVRQVGFNTEKFIERTQSHRGPHPVARASVTPIHPLIPVPIQQPVIAQNSQTANAQNCETANVQNCETHITTQNLINYTKIINQTDNYETASLSSFAPEGGLQSLHKNKTDILNFDEVLNLIFLLTLGTKEKLRLAKVIVSLRLAKLDCDVLIFDFIDRFQDPRYAHWDLQRWIGYLIGHARRLKSSCKISPIWQPDEKFQIELLAGGYTERQLDILRREFILYWTERGDQRDDWDRQFERFINHNRVMEMKYAVVI